MTSVANINQAFPASQGAASAGNSNNDLGQDDFMTLMVAQLENQDPTNPMDNFEFLSQIAQFGTVNGIQDLNAGVAALSSALLSNQALQAADLVGHDVITGSNIGHLGEDGELDAQVILPKPAAEVTLYVQDASGRLLLTRPLGPAAAGNLSVQWDGTDEDGNRMPAGEYRVSAEALIGGVNQAVAVNAHQRVESVTVDPTGLGILLNLAGGQQVRMAEVKSIF